MVQFQFSVTLRRQCLVIALTFSKGRKVELGAILIYCFVKTRFFFSFVYWNKLKNVFMTDQNWEMTVRQSNGVWKVVFYTIHESPLRNIDFPLKIIIITN